MHFGECILLTPSDSCVTFPDFASPAQPSTAQHN